MGFYTTSPEEAAKTAYDVLDGMKAYGGLRDVFCVACGGSLGSLYPLYYLLRSEAKQIHAQCMTAGEFAYDMPNRVGKTSVVVLLSASGATPETCAAAKAAQEKGAVTICISGRPDTQLHSFGTYCWVSSMDTTDSKQVNSLDMSLVLRFGFELLNLQESYEYYSEALHGFAALPDICKRTRRMTAPRAVKFGREHAADRVIYTVSGGPSFFAGYMESICHFMEMEWINSFAIHAGELFHGPFEITDRNTPFVVFMNSGPTRTMDERALRFLQTYSGRVTLVDANEFGVSQTGPHVEAYFSGIVNWLSASQMDRGLEAEKDHPFMERRYMGRVDY